MGDGCSARANTDTSTGDEHAERDAYAQRNGHVCADIDKHAGGGMDAVADADAEAYGAFANTHADTDAALKVSCLADADEYSGESVPDLFAVTDADPDAASQVSYRADADAGNDYRGFGLNCVAYGSR